MPRPPRQGGTAPSAASARDPTMTTPTRRTVTNGITAAIPPFMLETPPHAPFLPTQGPPSNPPPRSVAPAARARRDRQTGPNQQTPTALTDTRTPAAELSQSSHHPLSGPISDDGQAEEQSLMETVPHGGDDTKQLIGLRDISSLATWTLSSAKPGCALAQLRHPNPENFWQSDGPQPHTLTLHFFKLVAIIKMRIYLDFGLDESYTPTKMKFFAGMSEGGLVEFGSWEVVETTDPETGEVHSSITDVRGWIDVPLKGVGGREKEPDGSDRRSMKAASRPGRNGVRGTTQAGVDFDESSEDEGDGKMRTPGDVLKAMVVQIRICENHQNGKDTHVRGFQVFARDEAGMKDMRKVVKKKSGHEDTDAVDDQEREVIGLQPAEWMGEPEIR